MSSTGQIVGGVVGAVVGAFMGNPILGAQIGMTIGGVIDPPKGPNVKGPRLEDLTIQTSTYGALIPRVYATVGLTGNVIWLENNRLLEVEKEESAGGKGGGGGTVTTYEYYATFAVGLAEAKADGTPLRLGRVWLGPELFYDPAVPDMSTLEEEPDGFFAKLEWQIMGGTRNSKFFRFYDGSSTQQPDPRMEAQFGVGNVPAYRGLAYIVFENLPLKKFGNALPVVMCELIEDGSVEPVKLREMTFEANQYAASIDLLNPDGRTFLIERETYGSGSSTRHKLYAHSFVAGGRDVGRWPLDDYAGSQYSSGIYNVLSGQTLHISWAAVVRNGGGSAYLHTESGDYPGNLYGDIPAGITEDLGYVVMGGISSGNDYAWLWNVLPELIGRFPVPMANRLTMKDTYLYAGTPTGVNVYKPSPSGLTLQSSHTLDYPSASFSGYSRQYIDDYGLYWVAWIAGGDGIYLRSYRMADWSLEDTYHFENPALSTAVDILNIQIRDGIFVVMYDNGGNGLIGGAGPSPTLEWWILNGQNQQPVPLADIVEAECLRSNLIELADLDTSQLTDLVKGYRVPGDGSIRAAVEPLQGAFLFDVVASGYGLKFVPRGQESIKTVPWTELVPSNGRIIEHETEMDSQLPARVGIKYLDANRDYNVTEQYSERLGTDAVNTTTLEIPIVFNADEAAQKAEILINMYWMEREQHKFMLPPTCLGIEPSDVITVETEYDNFEVRGTEIEYQEDGVLAVNARSARPSVYVSTVEGVEGTPGTTDIAFPGSTDYKLLDLPVILDVQNQPGIVLAMAGYTDTWPGGVLLRSPDSQVWTQLRAVTGSATYGFAGEPLGEHDGLLLDRGSVLTVGVNEPLSSTTEASMLNGANYAAYGAPGRWEIIRFVNAAQNAEGDYDLTVLKRGDRGTEWATGLHQLGDQFVLLDDPDNAFVAMPLDLIGVERRYRGVTAGEDIDTATDRAYTYQGTNLKPYAGAHPEHVAASNGDITVSWQRRTRLGGEWRDYVDATLSEASEAYEVDVVDNQTSAIVRTISAGTPSIFYSKADQEADGVLAVADLLTVVNPGAETGDTTGWTTTTGALSVKTGDQYTDPHSGTYLFYGGNLVLTIAHQDVDASAFATEIDAGSALAELVWFQSGYNGSDDGKFVLEFYDAGMSLLGSADSGFWAGTDWIERSLRPAIPTGTRTMRIVMRMERDAGSENSVYVDDISLGVIANGVPDATFQIYQLSETIGRGYPLEYTPE